MPKLPMSDFGKLAKKRLIDIEKSQVWLISKVQEDTGLYFDDSYLHKIFTGKLATPKIVASICNILEIDPPDGKESSAQMPGRAATGTQTS